MKNTSFILAFLLVFLISPRINLAQCTPGNEVTCPDPENNGEICPDVLPDAVMNQLYQQEFTILAPAQYTDSTSGITVDLDHLRIVDVGNLPTGITWVSNAPDDILLPGVYNCVLMEGTPQTKGNYTLKINVEVTINFFGQPVLYDTIVDSTSLAINVVDASGIGEFSATSFNILSSVPNPFTTWFEVLYTMKEPGEMSFKLYNLLGKLIRMQTIPSITGENRFVFDATGLPQGIYIYSLGDSQNSVTRRMIKSR